jgi:nucleotide-binding universal stress UspA family protein
MSEKEFLIKEERNMLPFKKILCPTDFSESSYKALKVADELTLHFSAELTLVHIVSDIPSTAALPSPTASGPEPIPSPGFNVKRYKEELDNKAKEALEEIISEKVSSRQQVQAVVAHGDAANEIVRIAEEENVDLIVIATHGRTGWRRFAFGSVAEKVVRHAPLPVLTIQAAKENE